MNTLNPYLLFTGARNNALENIIDGMLHRDDQALEALYELTLSRVYGLAMKITQHKELAEEVVVDTYWQAWRDAVDFNPDKGPLIAWLLVICRSRAIDAIRKNAVHQTANADGIGLHEDGGTDPDPSSGPDSQLQQSQSDALLHRYMNALTALQRQMMHLAYFKGLTHEEIAQQMHMPLGSVKSNIKRAQASLKQQLTQLDQL